MADEIDADEVLALQEEYAVQQMPGWQRKRMRLALLLQEKGKPLMLGQLATDRERHQQEGWCQALNFLLDQDQMIEQSWLEYQREQAGPGEEELEGGDHGLFYEASQ